MTMPPRNNRNQRSSPEPPPKTDVASSSSSSPLVADNFSAPSAMQPLVLPPGFMFVPTDEVLISSYLKPFLQRTQESFPNVPIHLVNIYKSNPEQLSKEFVKGNDKEWFFITERTKISEGGKNVIRTDKGGGFWKATKTGTKIEDEHSVVANKNSLAYGKGSVKGDWLMQEYSCDSDDGNETVDHALCKIYLTPKELKRRAAEEENEKKKKKKNKTDLSGI